MPLYHWSLISRGKSIKPIRKVSCSGLLLSSVELVSPRCGVVVRNSRSGTMLSLGVVEPSLSAWSSPIMLLDKPDGSKRFIVDFRAVNTVSSKDAYPLPQVTSILDRLRDARYLSSLDIKSAYWQIELEENSKEKTAFAIPGRGLYQFVTMPFGLCGAPATWQRFVDTVLGFDLEPHVFVYLDDIIVVTSSFEKHLEVLSEIFRRTRAANSP